jgi:Zn-dependent membrane protease YugP
MTPGIMLVSLLFIGISLIVSMILKGKFSKYSKIPLANGMSGKEVAEKMLRENGIFDVKVTASQGFLSDHYDPANKTVNLIPEVYEGTIISSAAVQSDK